MIQHGIFRSPISSLPVAMVKTGLLAAPVALIGFTHLLSATLSAALIAAVPVSSITGLANIKSGAAPFAAYCPEELKWDWHWRPATPLSCRRHSWQYLVSILFLVAVASAAERTPAVSSSRGSLFGPTSLSVGLAQRKSLSAMMRARGDDVMSVPGGYSPNLFTFK